MAGSRFDLNRLGLRSGERWTDAVPVAVEPIELGGVPYRVVPDPLDATLTVDQMAHGKALTIAFEAELHGPCHRCLADALARVEVKGRALTGAGRRGADDPDLETPHVEDGAADLAGWATEEIVLALPVVILHAEDCAGLCAGCGVDLNTEACRCEPEPTDSRWDALRGLFPQG